MVREALRGPVRPHSSQAGTGQFDLAPDLQGQFLGRRPFLRDVIEMLFATTALWNETATSVRHGTDKYSAAF